MIIHANPNIFLKIFSKIPTAIQINLDHKASRVVKIEKCRNVHNLGNANTSFLRRILSWRFHGIRSRAYFNYGAFGRPLYHRGTETPAGTAVLKLRKYFPARFDRSVFLCKKESDVNSKRAILFSIVFFYNQRG